MQPRPRARFKIIFLGESQVGKTSLVRRYIHGSFSEAYLTTIGATVSKHIDRVPLGGREVEVAMVVWDIMGNKRILDLLGEAYFDGSSGALAVFDVTRPETLQVLGAWVETARHIVDGIPFLVLGNKVDLGDERKIRDEEAREYCLSLDLQYMPTSAKTGLNVEEAFRALAREALKGVAVRKGPAYDILA